VTSVKGTGVRLAEAEAERVRILALADAEKMKIQAEAAAAHDRVALDRMLIDKLPEIVKQAAPRVYRANLTVLNGADELGEIATGLVGPGLAIFDSLRGGLGQHQSGEGSDQIGLNAPAQWPALIIEPDPFAAGQIGHSVP